MRTITNENVKPVHDLVSIEEIIVSKHEVEELPGDGMEGGNYVLIKFSGKRTNCHYITILRHFVEPEKTT